MHRGTAEYSTTLPPDTCAQRNRATRAVVHSSGRRGRTAPGYTQAPSSMNTQRPDATGGTGRGQTTPRLLAGMLMAVTKARGEGDSDGGTRGGTSSRGQSPRRLAGHSKSPCPGDGWQGLTGLRSALLHAHEVPGRARKGPLLPPPPLATRSAPRTLAGPTSIGAGSPGRAHPQPPACAQASCLGAAAQGPLPCWQGPARISPRARVFSSPSVPRSPQTQNHTLPALIHSADHPSALKQEPDHAGGTTPLTHSGRAHKTRCPGQLKTPATQGGQRHASAGGYLRRCSSGSPRRQRAGCAAQPRPSRP